MVLVGIVFTYRLLSLQVLDSTYEKKAESNIISREIQYPHRGIIYDRNGKILVHNKPEFDLMVIPTEVRNLDVGKFCEILEISRAEYIESLNEATEYSRVLPSIFKKQISNEEFARMQDHLVEFPGFYIKARTGRSYPYPTLANALGFVSEISRDQIDQDTSNYYRQGDYIGQSGIESYYEEYLRGQRGVRYRIKNVKGETKGSFREGEYDTLAVAGLDLKSTIDIDLQLYADTLMANKAGSVVAIEPSTGEILAFVSGPSYDPEMLTGRKFSSNFSLIASDTNKPLFNRPLMAQYRPGSIFKIMQAMVALEQGVVNKATRIECNRNIIGCHGSHSYEDLTGAIQHSCNPYFHNVMRRMVQSGRDEDAYKDSRLGLEKWEEMVRRFGFGSPLGIDLPNEKGGLIPNVQYYDRAYSGRPWKYSNIYSIAIGEGENLIVPIQMANFAATVANRGFYYTPHLIKEIGEDGEPLDEYQERNETGISAGHFEIAANAMQLVVEGGTGGRARIPGIEVCGKTGSVQNDPLPDHSVFIAFAPKDDPKIAISVYVESAGAGGRSAASIAGLLIEKYLTGEIKRHWIETYVHKNDFLY